MHGASMVGRSPLSKHKANQGKCFLGAKVGEH